MLLCGLSLLMGQSSPAFPGFRQSIGLMIAVMMVSFVLIVPYAIVAGGLGGAFQLGPAVLAVVNSVAFTVVSWWGFRRTKLGFGEVFPGGAVKWDTMAAVIPLIVGAVVVESEVDNIFRSFVPPSRELIEMFKSMMSNREAPLASVVLLVGVAPWTEEPMFRGLILGGMLRRYTPWKAMAASAFLFAAMHLNPYQFFGALCFGMVAAWMRWRTGSLWPGIGGHMLHNSFPIVAALLPFEIRGLTSDPMGPVSHQPWWLNAGGLALLGMGLWWFRKTLYCERNAEAEHLS